MRLRRGGRPAALLLAAALAGSLVACDGEVRLPVGTCFDPPEIRGDFAEAAAIPCADPHHAEVVFNAAYEGGGDYDELALSDFADARCADAFRSYTGRDLATDDAHDVGSWYPSESEWSTGRRRVVCFLVQADGGEMVGTQRAP